MASLSDFIEEYLKKLLSLSGRGYVDIQRSELAEKFDCVPSQINYVLATRFTPGKGYLVESRRGGRGYVRITRLRLPRALPLGDQLLKMLGDKVSESQAADFIRRLFDERMITQREMRLLLAASAALTGADDERQLRGRLLGNMLLALLKP